MAYAVWHEKASVALDMIYKEIKKGKTFVK